MTNSTTSEQQQQQQQSVAVAVAATSPAAAAVTTPVTTTATDANDKNQLPDSLHGIIRSFLAPTTINTNTNEQSTTTMKGNNGNNGNGDKVVVGDDFIHITLTNTDSSSNDIVMDGGESSAALVEATAELAAATVAASSSSTSTTSTADESLTSTTVSSMDESKDENDGKKEEEAVAVEESEGVEEEEDKSHDDASLLSIKKIGENIERKVWELQRVTQRLADHIVRLIALSWRVRTIVSHPSLILNDGSSSSLNTSARAAKSMSNKMEYEAGVASEWLFSQLMLLDNIRGSSVVRRARKDMVARIKSAVSTADNIRARAKRAALAFHSIIDRQVAKLPTPPATPSPTPSPATPSVAPTVAPSPTTTPAVSDEKKKATVSSDESSDNKRSSSPTPTPAASSATPSAPVPVRDASLRWSPEFQSREVMDGAIITSTIPGIQPSSLTVTVNESKRTLTIGGTRRVKQRVIDNEATAAAMAKAKQLDEAEAAHYANNNDDEAEDEEDEYSYGGYGGWFGLPIRRQPQRRQVATNYHQRRIQQQPITKVIEVEQWFNEELQLPRWLSLQSSLYRTSIDTSNGGILTITIPRAPVATPAVTKSSSSKAATAKAKAKAAPAKRRRATVDPLQALFGGHSYAHDHGDDDEVNEESEEVVPPYSYGRRVPAPSYYQPQYQYVRPSPSYGYGPSPFGFGW